jgi:predicted CoA-binding protein
MSMEAPERQTAKGEAEKVYRKVYRERKAHALEVLEVIFAKGFEDFWMQKVLERRQSMAESLAISRNNL